MAESGLESRPSLTELEFDRGSRTILDECSWYLFFFVGGICDSWSIVTFKLWVYGPGGKA